MQTLPLWLELQDHNVLNLLVSEDRKHCSAFRSLGLIFWENPVAHGRSADGILMKKTVLTVSPPGKSPDL